MQNIVNLLHRLFDLPVFDDVICCGIFRIARRCSPAMLTLQASFFNHELC